MSSASGRGARNGWRPLTVRPIALLCGEQPSTAAFPQLHQQGSRCLFPRGSRLVTGSRPRRALKRDPWSASHRLARDEPGPASSNRTPSSLAGPAARGAQRLASTDGPRASGPDPVDRPRASPSAGRRVPALAWWTRTVTQPVRQSPPSRGHVRCPVAARAGSAGDGLGDAPKRDPL